MEGYFEIMGAAAQFRFSLGFRVRLLWFSSGVASLGVQLELQCVVRLSTIKV